MHLRSRTPRLVIDPSLPAPVSAKLLASPQALRVSRVRGARPPVVPDPVALFSLLGLLVLVLALTSVAGMVLTLGAIGMVTGVRWMTKDPSERHARRRLRLALDHADRFVLPEDLDAECGAMLRRAQDAVETVLSSQVNQAGLIDTIDNGVTLPEEMWRIAHRLARLSAMRVEHRRIVPRDPPSEVAEAFTPYRDALEAAQRSLNARVCALEDYAEQVRRSDGMFLAYRQLELLAERTPDYERLVAEAAQDQVTLPQIERMSEQAEQVRELFQQSIDGARRAGAHLLADADD